MRRHSALSPFKICSRCPVITRHSVRISFVALLFGLVCPISKAVGADPLLEILQAELTYSMEHLKSEDGTKPYYLSYSVTDTESITLSAELGALLSDRTSRRRVVDIDLRVGSHELDNTHQIRGQRGGFGSNSHTVSTVISLDNNEGAIRHDLWRATDQAFKSADESFRRVKANLRTQVKEADKSHDFSVEEPSTSIGPLKTLSLDQDDWKIRLRRLSEASQTYPLVLDSGVGITASVENRYFASSEGTQLRFGRKLLRVIVSASTRAEDGMELDQAHLFNISSEENLPSEEEIQSSFNRVLDQVMALREAPLVEPYVGPAILLNRASGVFFHEIFGHRIEGHRQKNIEEGQTFAKMIGQPILPEFLSVTDDPTRAQFQAEDLRGFYPFDDEGISPSKVELVKNGVLQTFLLSRSPVGEFTHSNGHGRREPGRSVVSRQGNLIISSTRQLSFEDLKEQLRAECRRQGKPFGLLFEDITGGFTMTQRSGPQSFKVLPVVVWKVPVDGGPDQLVRGVDIVGTPLSCFSKILATGDDPAVFNGTCGAESGWVPVSAVSPSILVEQIEIEKRQSGQSRQPLLPSPITPGS